jgi:hypothetical protein
MKVKNLNKNIINYKNKNTFKKVILHEKVQFIFVTIKNLK